MARRILEQLTLPRIIGIWILLSILSYFWLSKKTSFEVFAKIVTDRDHTGQSYSRGHNLQWDRRQGADEEEMDLKRWEGELLLLDIEGEARSKWLFGKEKGYVACAATLITPQGTKEIEFFGWENRGEHLCHPGLLGTPSYIAPFKDERRFFYGKEGRLRHVFKAPKDGTLRLSFLPVTASQMENARRFLPKAKRMRLPVKKPRAKPAGRPPDVFIFLVDAMRPDHLGCYGYDRPTSPAIDAFSQEAVLFEEAHTPVTWTRPAVATILTGLYPSMHGVVHSSGGAGPHTKGGERLEDWPLTLPEALKEAGYATCAVTTNANITETFGFSQGFDRHEFAIRESAEWVNAQAEKWLAAQGAEQPVFLYLHLMEPHSPYTPGPAAKERFDRHIPGRYDGTAAGIGPIKRVGCELTAEDRGRLLDLYDAEVWEADRGFGDFLDLLRRTGRYENSLIILLSDHGEAFGEHNTFEHGRSLNREEMRVALIARFPQKRRAGSRVKMPASLIDIFPTVLAQAGARPALPYRTEGLDLEALAAESAETSARPLFAEVSRYENNRLDLIGIVDEAGYKQVFDVSAAPGGLPTKASVGLWDTGRDPAEQHDLREEYPALAAYHEQLAAQWLIRQYTSRLAIAAKESTGIELPEDIREELEALGYLD